VWGFSAFGEVPFGGLPDERVVPGAFEVFASSALQSRLLIEVSARSLSAVRSSVLYSEGFGDFAFGDGPESGGAPVNKTFYFSNGKFAGRPDDGLRANRRYVPRVLNSADIERSLPQSPSEQAGALNIGSIDLANNDGALDFLLTDYTIANSTITIRMVQAGGYVQDGRIIGTFFGDVMEGSRDKLTLRLKSITDFLQKPLTLNAYTGAGGINGDAELANTVKPVAFGPCFNITPVLISRENWIYQVHDGRVFSIDTVREIGLDFINDGDVASFAALLAAVVPSGHYVTCLDLGLFKAGFSGEPAGLVTADVRGDTDANGTYTADLGDILLRIATKRAGLGSESINLASFTQLPLGDVNYFANEQTTCADAYRYLLGGVYGWFAPGRSNLLEVGYLTPPEDSAPAFTMVDKLALDIEELNITWLPIYQQSVLYNRNWTVMTTDQISELVGSIPTTATRKQLTSNGDTATLTSPATQLRRQDSIVGEPVQSPFCGELAQANATGTSRRIMAINSEGRHLYRLTNWRFSLLLNLQDTILLQNKRFGLSGGKNAQVMSLRDSGGGEGGTLTVLV